MLSSCSKYIVYGTDKYKLDEKITIDPSSRACISFNPGCIKYNNYDSIYWHSISMNNPDVYYIYNESGETIISRIECDICEKKDIRKTLQKLKNYHDLVSKEKEGSNVIYTFTDIATNNIVIAKYTRDNLHLSFISNKYQDMSFKDSFDNYEQIKGTDGFILHMSKNAALSNAAKKGLKVCLDTNINGINRVCLNYLGEMPLEKKILFYSDTYNFSENVICLEFIKDEKGNEILCSYYATEIWDIEQNDYYHNTNDIFNNFVKPLMNKYHVYKVGITEIKNSEDDYFYYFNNKDNSDYLYITFNTNNFLKNTIKIKYSIDDAEKQKVIDSYKESEKEIERAKKEKKVNKL